MPLYFKPGHKIDKPTLLFTKIEQTRLDELKQKYGGQQETTPTAAPEQQFKSAAEFEKAIQLQGEKVRTLKANKTEKPLLDPEIAVLLKLKKDLQALLEKEKTSTPTKEQPTDAAQKIKNLEEQITKQGEKVRNLKATGDKTLWQPEVDVLLKLKNELTALTGTAAQPTSGKNKKKK